VAAIERTALRRLGDHPAVVVLTFVDKETLTVATAAEHRGALAGPFAGESLARSAPALEGEPS